MKKIIFFVLTLILITGGIIVLLGHSVVIFPQELPPRDYAYQSGQKVNPLEEFNFSDGKWTAFVVFSDDDRSRLPTGIENSRVIRCDDKHVLQEMQNQLEFHDSGGDMTTVASRIVLYKNDRLMFDSGLVVETGMEGFQSRDFG